MRQSLSSGYQTTEEMDIYHTCISNHIGGLPLLCAKRYENPIICTDIVRQGAEMLLYDSFDLEKRNWASIRTVQLDRPRALFNAPKILAGNYQRGTELPSYP